MYNCNQHNSHDTCKLWHKCQRIIGSLVKLVVASIRKNILSQSSLAVSTPDTALVFLLSSLFLYFLFLLLCCLQATLVVVVAPEPVQVVRVVQQHLTIQGWVTYSYRT